MQKDIRITITKHFTNKYVLEVIKNNPDESTYCQRVYMKKQTVLDLIDYLKTYKVK